MAKFIKRYQHFLKKWKWIDSLTPAQRAELKQDIENEKKRYELELKTKS